jgi:hypothetical protein
VDLRAYYRKVREVESGLPEPFVVVVSHETPDGGRPGVLSEVSRHTAARQIAEGRSRTATQDEADVFHKNNLEVKRAADETAAMNRMQMVVVPARRGGKGLKDLE